MNQTLADTLVSTAGQQNMRDVLAEDEVNNRGAGGTTKLMSAAHVGDMKRIQALVLHGADLNLRDDYGWTALRFAVRRKDLPTVRLLIELGADVNLASSSGRTPLMSAVANNAPDVVQFLIEQLQAAGCCRRRQVAAAGGAAGVLVVEEPHAGAEAASGILRLLQATQGHEGANCQRDFQRGKVLRRFSSVLSNQISNSAEESRKFSYYRQCTCRRHIFPDSEYPLPS